MVIIKKVLSIVQVSDAVAAV